MQYHKIQSVWKRDPENNFKTFLRGDFSRPEFQTLWNADWEFTEKVDGTNIRIIWVPGDGLTLGGKTDRAQIPGGIVKFYEDNALPQLAWFEDFFPQEYPHAIRVTLYGEGYGGKIQRGGKYREDQSVVFFDILVERENGTRFWMNRGDAYVIFDQLAFDRVPILMHGPLSRGVEICERGFASQWGDFEAEGVIARPVTELVNTFDERVITKLKCADFPK